MEKDLGRESTMYRCRVTSSQSVIFDLAERVFIRDLDPVGIRVRRTHQFRTGESRTVVEHIGLWPGLTNITESEEEQG